MREDKKELVVMPTHNCFDDTKTFLINEYVRKHITFYSLCHGVCKHENGKPYSHAWIMNQEIILDFGLIEGKLNILQYKRGEFFEKLNVQWFREYKLAEAIASEAIAEMPGPWDNELRAMCTDTTTYLEKDREKIVLLFGKIWRLKK